MPDDANPPRTLGFHTRLSHGGRPGTRTYGFVNPPVMRGSTVLQPNVQARQDTARRAMDQALIYGVMGNPTHHALEDVVADIEGGTRCQIVSSGLAAVTTALLAYVKAGDHILVTDSVYGPTRDFCDGMLRRMGVETQYYAPTIDGAGLAALLRPNTSVVFLESPGSHSFEMQDIPALAAAAHAQGARVLMDNTWGLHVFQPFRHGVDASIQALTKYLAGHSDVLLGSITTNTDADWHRVRTATLSLGQYASPDDCWLALRGARTLAVRLERQAQSALEVAQWLAARPEVDHVRHPALPGAPGHALWKRDFSGACSLFGVVFRPDFPRPAARALIDAMTLFGIGASWGGYESLVLPSDGTIRRAVTSADLGGPAIRLHIGLEDPADLIADLEVGLTALRQFGR